MPEHHRSSNPGLQLQFRYITTAPVKIERDWPDDNGGIATWEALRLGKLSGNEGRAALAVIRQSLKRCECPERAQGAWKYLEKVLDSADENTLVELIEAFEWGTSAEDYLEIEARIKATLLKAGYRDSETSSQQLFEQLFVYVFRRLAEKGLKRLTKEELAQEVTQTTVSDNDHALFQLVRSQMERLSSRISKVEQEVEELGLMQQSIAALVESAGVAISLNSPDAGVIFDPPELVSPAIGRDAAVRTILDGLRNNTLIMIVGEPGSGKTQLCLLTVEQIKLSVVWISIARGSTETQASLTIDRAVELLTHIKRNDLTIKEWYSQAAEAARGKLVVIDDVPRMVPGGTLSRRLETLRQLV